MTGAVSTPRWRVLGHSVQGASHCRRGLPNQDALACWPGEAARCALIALADGHGSADCPRSAEGARLAVETALDVLRAWLGEEDPAAAQDIALEASLLPEVLTDHWQNAVRQHLSLHPWAEPPEGSPFTAYGTTLLAAAVMPGQLLLLQIGDGDVLTVSEAGVVQRPLPRDGRLLANETTSLSSAEAANDFLVRVLDITYEVPALVMLSTDGYSNSFRDEEAFRQVGGDLLAMIRAEGLEAVAGSMAGWLREASEQGSGDDVTLGLMCRVDQARRKKQP
jgi:serine/threonine protein phosphatase PrpC